MTTGHRLPGVDQLVAAFRTFRYSVFRLESLQVYAGSGEDEGITAFHRGDPDPPPDPAEDEWAALLRANRDAGRLQQRVHVATEPISDYLAYELTWQYGPHVAAGEDIRIIAVHGAWPDDVPQSDFTLFDSSRLFQLSYRPDGTWLGAQPVTDHASVVAACRSVDVRVLPAAAPSPILPLGGFSIHDDDTLWCETLTRETRITDPEDIAAHTRAFELARTASPAVRLLQSVPRLQ
ncbi:MAG: DUF6879 family protein [Pseudonocardiaceae bacterium]